MEMPKKSLDYKKLAEELAIENSSLTEQLQRERADAANVRRRADEDRLKMASYYKATVIRELLPVIDNFERALKHVPMNLKDDDYIKGIQGVVKKFEQTLEKLGLQRIKTVDENFDPNLHEAVSAEEGDGDQEIVTEELQSGWILGSEVLRHAMVRVSSK